MTTGDWKESASRSITVSEWDEGTIQQLLHYLYHGTYSIPAPSNDDDASSTSPRPRYFTQQLTKEEIRRRPLPPLIYIDCLGPRDEVPLGKLPEKDLYMYRNEPDIQLALSSGYTLLPDARVYVLAHYLQLDGLQRLAFHRIQDVLVRWGGREDGEEILEKVVEVVGYVYVNTITTTGTEEEGGKEVEKEEEPLRNLLSSFVAKEFREFHGPEFEGLVFEGGEFMVDMVRKIARVWKG
ncbi:MAG: hypothetical protein LQ346_008934 [Caloplaca aetnensis]|nr:MAG: hypothetical protein LQ346_008934 [Caloplaca aetnensis]